MPGQMDLCLLSGMSRTVTDISEDQKRGSSLRLEGQWHQHRGEGRNQEQEESEKIFLKRVKGRVGRPSSEMDSSVQS